MKDICGVSRILFLMLSIFCLPTCSSLPQNELIDGNPDYDYGVEKEMLQGTVYQDESIEGDLKEFVTWADEKEATGAPVSRIPTRRPSEKEMSDNKDQAIGAINSRSVLPFQCQNPKGCNNCFMQGKSSGFQLLRVPCPKTTVESGGQRNSIEKTDLLFFTITIVIGISCFNF